jgi:outer membrane receptor protein involved in Fe transport
MFWYVDEIGTFGFAQGRNTRLFAGAEVEYHPVGGLKLAASARAHLDYTKSTMYAVSDPKIVANILAEYRLKRWKFGISGDFIGRREWSGNDLINNNYALEFLAPATFDLHADVAFKLTNGVEFFVNGYNLLNQDIYDYAYYYRNGIGFMVGAKIDF